MENEIWVELEFTNNQYSVSNLGRVKNTKSGRILKFYSTRFNYNACKLSHGDYPKNFRAHRLVAQAFIPNPENKPCVNHIDNDPKNNTVSNLEWVTHRENTQHSLKQGRMRRTPYINYFRAKLTNDDVLEIRKLIPLLEYKEIAKRYNISISQISHIKTGKRWSFLK